MSLKIITDEMVDAGIASYASLYGIADYDAARKHVTGILRAALDAAPDKPSLEVGYAKLAAIHSRRIVRLEQAVLGLASLRGSDTVAAVQSILSDHS